MGPQMASNGPVQLRISMIVQRWHLGSITIFTAFTMRRFAERKLSFDLDLFPKRRKLLIKKGPYESADSARVGQ